MSTVRCCTRCGRWGERGYTRVDDDGGWACTNDQACTRRVAAGGWDPPALVDLPHPATATVSDDGRYRYDLTRAWGYGQDTALFVMLNPSTADATLDDPTIRRCRSFARREGADRLVVVNLYAYRSTDPRALLTAPDPVGPDNDTTLRSWFGQARDHGWPVIAAWGNNASQARARQVEGFAADAGCRLSSLGMTDRGAPPHPLYLRRDQPLRPWPPT